MWKAPAALILLIRWFLAGVFIWSALSKILHPLLFADAIASYHLLPDSLIGPLALWLPWFEVTLAVGILIPSLKSAAALGMASLCILFAFALGSAWVRGLPIDCGCFGGNAGWFSEPLPALVRSLVLLALSLACRQALRFRDPACRVAPACPKGQTRLY